MSNDSKKIINDSENNLISGHNNWMEYQMHVLTTLSRLDETFSKLEDQIKHVEQRENKNMTELREELYEIRSKMENGLNDVRMQLKAEELVRLADKLESARQEGAWEERVDSHIEKRTKVNWIIISALIGSGFALLNLLFKFIFSNILGIE